MNNRFTGKINIIGKDDGDLQSAIVVNFVDDTPSSLGVRLKGDANLASSFSIPDKVDLPSQVTVKAFDDLISSITLGWGNKFTGIFEVQQPPQTELLFTPIQDAFIRSGLPKINYGKTMDMLVGEADSGELFKSLIQFDTSSILKT